MEYPTEFYYTESSSARQFGSQPSNSISISRLIEGQTYFEALDASQKQQPKIMVLSAWQAQSWNSEKVTRVTKLIESMIQDGFEIYLLQGENFKALTLENYTCLDSILCRRDMSPLSHNDLYQDFCENRMQTIARDRFLILDDYWCDAATSETKERELSINSLIALDEKDRELALDQLSKEYPPLSRVIIDKFSSDIEKNIVIVHKYFPKIHYENKIQHLRLTNRQASAEVLCEKKALQAMLSIKGVNFSTLESIEYRKCYSEAKVNITKLLSQYSGLSSLKLINTNISVEGNIDASVFDGLSTINLSECKFESPEVFSALFSQVIIKSSGLSSLTLDRIDMTQNINDIQPGKKLKLESLEEIDISRSKISYVNFLHLISSAPNLKMLNITGCVFTGEIIDLDIQQKTILNGIETLEVQKVNDKIPSWILPLCENLQTLVCGHQQGIIEGAHWESLSHLTLDSTDELIKLSTLYDIITRAKNLKYLSCNGIEGDELNYFKDGFSSPITTFNISTLFNADANSLNKLLQQLPELRVLSMVNVHGLRDLDVVPLFTKNSMIEELVFHQFGADKKIDSAEVFLRSIAQLSKLKKLQISQPFDMDLYLQSEDGIHFPALRELTLSNDIKMDSTSINTLFSGCGGITKLTIVALGSGAFIANTLFLNLSADGIQLNKLQYVNLNGMPIYKKALTNLLNSCPNVETLNLSVGSKDNDKLNLTSTNMLTDLTLSYGFAIHDINTLVLQSEGVKILCLDNAILLETIIDTSGEKHLLKLKDLTIRLQMPNLDVIEKILNAARNLRSITLRDKTFLIREDRDVLCEIKHSNVLNEENTYHMHSGVNAKKTLSNGLGDVLEEHYTDADTEDKDVAFNLERIFYSPAGKHPEPSAYRLNVYNIAELNSDICTVQKAFILKRNGDLNLQGCDVKKSEQAINHRVIGISKKYPHKSCYLGQQTFILTNQWQPLASLTTEDILLEYHLSVEADTEIQYSQRDDLYYIRGKESSQRAVRISFILLTPTTRKTTTPQVMESKVNELKRFRSGKLILDKEKLSGVDYYHLITNQKLGACRHRSFMAQYYCQQFYPKLPVRTVCNTVHAYIEVFFQGSWQKIDLGGYPAKENIKEDKNIFEQKKEVTVPKALYKATSTIPSTTLQYKNALSTWKKNEQHFQSAPQYCQFICASVEDKKSILIDMNSSAMAYAMALSFKDYCKNTRREYFYVHTPDDLICNSPYISIQQDNTGVLCDGPGGELYQFLTKESLQERLLFINYDNFNADDIIKFNSMLDDTSSVDGVPLPLNVKVIGFIASSKPACYQGSDFYSRFDSYLSCPLTHDHYSLAQYRGTPSAEKVDDMPFQINIFHASNWRSRLLGDWSLDGDSLIFHEGELITAITNGHTSIEIANGLWNDPEFQFFWNDIITMGEVHYQLATMPLPINFNYSITKGYNWNAFSDHIQPLDHINAECHILNQSLLSQYFGSFTCQDAMLHQCSGLIAQYANSSLPIYVTATLDEDSWAKILDCCHQNNVQLQVVLASGVTLPEGLKSLKVSVDTLAEDDNSRVIYCQDQELAIKLMCLSTIARPDMVIDISECDFGDLFVKIDAEFKQSELTFAFSHKTSAVYQALEQGKTVILKGQFSQELCDHLAKLIAERIYDDKGKGQLIIVTSDKASFNFVTTHDVESTAGLKFSVLNEAQQEIIKNNTIDVNTLSWNQLQSILRSSQPSDPKLPWIGMKTLAGGIGGFTPFNREKSAALAQEFIDNRRMAVNHALQRSPFVFLSGLTGVGKSTFVESELCQGNDSLFLGEDSLLEWVKSDNVGRKILFIDEANLGARKWSEFEGLFNTPAAIYIDGEYHRLSSEHKVVFAGNPLSYGDERQLPPLFEHHGNAVLFEPLSLALIYQKILLPVFEDTGLSDDTINKISDKILQVYQFICTCSESEVLISPRELQMMALLIVSHMDKSPNDDISRVSDHFIHKLAITLLSKKHHAAFCQIFPAREISTVSPELCDDFVITESRKPLLNQLQALLNLQEFRQSDITEQQKYGGLGGIIIEGSPGVGKSELVIHHLCANGFTEQRFQHAKDSIEDKAHDGRKKVFYRMPVSWSLEQKQACLLKAFDQGAIVIIDEINSSLMMERFLNQLLMGKNDQGKRPKKPGFLVIGTQNPISMCGRRPPSNALKRRMQFVELPDYPVTELIEILCARNIPKAMANDLAGAFDEVFHYAIKHNVNPAPTLRDLLRLADKLKDNLSQKAYRPSLIAWASNYVPSFIGHWGQTSRPEPKQELVEDKTPYLPCNLL